MTTFQDRRAAGRALTAALRPYVTAETAVLGVTRGGVVVGQEVARLLHLPFDVLVVHQIAVPGPVDVPVHVAAVAEPAHLVVNRRHLRSLALERAWLRDAVTQGVAEVRRQGLAYRGTRDRVPLLGRPVIVVADAATTGMTLRAAVRAVRALGAREVIVALPVVPAHVRAALARQADRVVALATPAHLIWQGIHYAQREDVAEEEICQLAQRPRAAMGAARASASRR